MQLSPPVALGSGLLDFSEWHLPLIAGEWRISRGPCNSVAPFRYSCDYYENSCAVDFMPISGSMQNVPVLAPQDGWVFFSGERKDAGTSLMLEHPDGRVSSFMHLARIVVASNEFVTQGQVVGYAGKTGNSNKPHLHFHVQPNAVQRECLDLKGLDEIDYEQMRAISKNLRWADLILADPPMPLPDWLATLTITTDPPVNGVSIPQQILLAPGASVRVPVALRVRKIITSLTSAILDLIGNSC